MKTKHKLYTFLLLLLISTSCKKEKLPSIYCNNPTSDIATVKSLIVGKWTWAYENYRDRFSQSTIIKTPQTEGITRQYHFSRNNDVQIYANNFLNTTETYEITTLDIVTGSEMDKGRVILLFKNKSSGQRSNFSPVRICNDTLILNYQAYSDTKRAREVE